MIIRAPTYDIGSKVLEEVGLARGYPATHTRIALRRCVTSPLPRWCRQVYMYMQTIMVFAVMSSRTGLLSDILLGGVT